MLQTANFLNNFPDGNLPPKLFRAVHEVRQHVQSPLPMIVSSALCSASIAFQGSYDVRRPGNIVGPISLSAVTIAEPNSRKSTTDTLFTKPIRDIEANLAELYEKACVEYETRKKIWEIQLRKIERGYGKTKRKADQICTNNLLQIELEAHFAKQPQPPEKIKLVYSDATGSALKHGMAAYPSAGLVSSEGATLFEGHAFEDLAFINDTWSGSTFEVSRRVSGSFRVPRPRLTLSAMIQPSVFKKFLESRGEAARGNGFWARVLISFPASTEGSRFNNPHAQIPDWVGLEEFQSILRNALSTSLSNHVAGKSERIILDFDDAAARRWTDFYNWIEQEIGLFGSLHAVKDFAGKLPENVARVAALFHLIEAQTEKIELIAVNSAINVCQWYLSEFQRLFASPPPVPEYLKDANELEFWLRNHCQNNAIPRNDIAKLGPFQLRKNKARREAALNFLVLAGKFNIFQGGNSRKMYVGINFNTAPVMPNMMFPTIQS